MGLDHQYHQYMVLIGRDGTGTVVLVVLLIVQVAPNNDQNVDVCMHTYKFIPGIYMVVTYHKQQSRDQSGNKSLPILLVVS